MILNETFNSTSFVIGFLPALFVGIIATLAVCFVIYKKKMNSFDKMKEDAKIEAQKILKKADIDGWGMPVCPSCNEPTYDDKRCFFCGQAIKLNEYLPKPLIVGWKGYKGVFIGGGYWIYYKGKFVLHAQCAKKFTPKDARKQLKTMPKLLKALEEMETRK